MSQPYDAQATAAQMTEAARLANRVGFQTAELTAKQQFAQLAQLGAEIAAQAQAGQLAPADVDLLLAQQQTALQEALLSAEGVKAVQAAEVAAAVLSVLKSALTIAIGWNPL